MNCPYCGSTLNPNAKFCTNCGAKLESQQQPAQAPTYTQSTYTQPTYTQPTQPAYRQAATPEIPKENFLAGILGAIIGAALGGLSIILLGRIGIISAVSGLLITVCTVKGYTLLAKNISAKGIIVCVALILITPYIADRIDWAILVSQELFRYDFGEAFAAIPSLIDAGVIDSGDYVGNLVKLYLFAALGALSILRGVIKK